MVHGETAIVFWILAGSCFAGLIGAIVIRRSEGSPLHTACTWLFHGCLMAVGVSAILFLRVPSGLGLLPGLTLGLMMVGTTCDFRPRRARTVA